MDNYEEIQRFREDILKNHPRLKPDSRFQFHCHPGVPCFNRCCRDVNILLTPFDVLRLKHRLGITSEAFLDRYVLLPFGPQQKLPVPVLRMNDDEEKRCPFSDEGTGCAVYSDRPWPCRMYPIGQASPSESSDQAEFYFLLKEEVCQGFQTDKEWTVTEWLDNQNVAEYDELGEEFKAIALHPRIQNGDPLEPKQMDMYFTACYDGDKFRRFLCETSFFDKFDLEPHVIEAIKKDDVALLRFGFRWLRFCLFKEPTLKVKDEIVAAKQAEFS